MASITGSSVSLKSTAHLCLASSLNSKKYGMKSAVWFRRASPAMPRGLRVSCAANAETVKKVSGIVKEQLALKDDVQITGQTKFAEIGADSLDTVEIVMKLEEEFGVSVEEENAQTITTIQEAADMIETLQKK